MLEVVFEQTKVAVTDLGLQMHRKIIKVTFIRFRAFFSMVLGSIKLRDFKYVYHKFRVDSTIRSLHSSVKLVA